MLKAGQPGSLSSDGTCVIPGDDGAKPLPKRNQIPAVVQQPSRCLCRVGANALTWRSNATSTRHS